MPHRRSDSGYYRSMILLASSSPRRAELLQQIGVDFEVFPVDIDESRHADEPADTYVLRIARSKADAALERLATDVPEYPVLAADTTIAIDDDIIGKPSEQVPCCDILDRLSGRSLEVLSAVALASASGLDWRLSRNRVYFRNLEAAEIEAYCASDEPRDKAGAYAIQGVAAVFVERIEGSYSSVMGLPLFETAELLRGAGMRIL